MSAQFVIIFAVISKHRYLSMIFSLIKDIPFVFDELIIILDIMRCNLYIGIRNVVLF